MTEATTPPIADDSFQRLVSEVGNEVHTLGCENQNDEDLSSRLMDLACRLWEISKHLPGSLSASPAGVVKPLERMEEMRFPGELPRVATYASNGTASRAALKGDEQ